MRRQCRPLPEAERLPQRGGAVDGEQGGAEGADATARHQIDLDRGLVQCLQHTGMVGAVGADAAQDDGRRPFRGIQVVRGAGSAGHGLPYSSWMVTSLTISNLRAPAGVVTATSSPASLLSSARPIGEAVEIMPFSASASSGITSW